MATKTSRDFLNNYTYVIVGCRHCYNSENDDERNRHFSLVRERLNGIESSVSIKDEIDFNKQSLDLCYNCDYSSPRLFNLVSETLEK